MIPSDEALAGQAPRRGHYWTSAARRLAPKRRAFANACDGIRGALSEQHKDENADTFSDTDSDDDADDTGGAASPPHAANDDGGGGGTTIDAATERVDAGELEDRDESDSDMDIDFDSDEEVSSSAGDEQDEKANHSDHTFSSDREDTPDATRDKYSLPDDNEQQNFVSFDTEEEEEADDDNTWYSPESKASFFGIADPKKDRGSWVSPKLEQCLHTSSAQQVLPSRGNKDFRLDTNPSSEVALTPLLGSSTPLKSLQEASGDEYDKASFQFSHLFHWSPVALRSPAKKSKKMHLHGPTFIDSSYKENLTANVSANSSPHDVSNTFSPCNGAWSQRVLTMRTAASINRQKYRPKMPQLTLQQVKAGKRPAFSPIKPQTPISSSTGVTFQGLPSEPTMMYTPPKALFTPPKERAGDNDNMIHFSWHSRASWHSRGSIAGLMPQMDVDNLLAGGIDFVVGATSPGAKSPRKRCVSTPTPKKCYSKRRLASPLSATPRERRTPAVYTTPLNKKTLTRHSSDTC